MYTIKKEFHFEYGHRVWSQNLNPEFSLDSCLACRHLHGHSGRVVVSLQSADVIDGMVTDFKHLNWFKKFLDDFLDHKMILDINDPSLQDLFPVLYKLISDKPGLVYEEISTGVAIKVVAPWVYEEVSQGMKEILEGLIFVDFVPTSENLTRWLYSIIQQKMSPFFKDLIKVESIQFFETQKSQSIYNE